jgi:hypothetical protein
LVTGKEFERVVPVTTNLGMPEWWIRLSEGESEQEASKQTTYLLGFMGYYWWLLLGGVAEILFGGIYFGSKAQAQLEISTAVLPVVYVLVGIAMVEIALGILKLRLWVYWAAIPLGVLLTGLATWELVRWITGTPITVEIGVFTIMNILFGLYVIALALAPGVYDAFHRATPLRAREFSPDLVICAIILTLPALCGALLVNYVDKHLSDPVLGLVYIGGGGAMIFMAYGALAKQTWSWFATWVWVGILTGLAVTVIVRRATGDGINTEGLIASIASLLFTATAVYYLLRLDVRRAFIHWRPKNPLFNPRFLLAGLLLTVFAVVLYLLPGVVGNQAVSYTVFGLAMGAIVGLLPNADPITKLMGFLLGLLLADATYLVRGGLLPYTKASNVIIVPLMLLVITGITALFRSTTWFVCMLLGAGTLYGLVEVEFQLAPSSYLATSTLALVSIFLSFGIGYMVSALLGLTLTPPSTQSAHPDAPTLSPEADTAKLPTAPAAVRPATTADHHRPTAEQPAVSASSGARSIDA